MNINRLLSRRDKDGSSGQHGHQRDRSREKSRDRKSRPLSSDGIIALFKSDPQKKLDKEVSQKIAAVRQMFVDHGKEAIADTQINYALSSKYADGDVAKAYEIACLFQESVEGAIKPIDPEVQMLGAENRGAVTCYLDALLFAMFARLASFEPMLYNSFEDEPRRTLSTLIRLWVNMLRKGMLIQTDVTQHLQEALAACGWADAANLEQQDTSEAFTFITDQLQLPLLTLKMDIYHTGKEDPGDDHKFVNERLLEVAVPEASSVQGRTIQLEDCLESYFNNRVEVVRHLERTHTLNTITSSNDMPWEEGATSSIDAEQGGSIMTSGKTVSTDTPISPVRPGARDRAKSIIRRTVLPDNGADDSFEEPTHPGVPEKSHGVVRKEVLMPAWQFFNLIPWYTTKNCPINNNAEIIAHFSQTRPVLGICLKRYSMTNDGQTSRQNTFIDIPLDIRLPHFLQDDTSNVDGSLMETFKLSLQSVICHRGTSLHAGHYIAFVRDVSQAADGDITSTRRLSTNSRPPDYPQEDRWIRLDDIASPRVTAVDIQQALRDEMPYLLFYQVQPTINISPPPETEPPSYTDSSAGVVPSSSLPRDPPLKAPPHAPGYFDGSREASQSAKHSMEIDPPRKSINLSEHEVLNARRGSVAHTDASRSSTATFDPPSTPATPTEESTAQRMSRAAARFKSSSRSRASSQTGENRLSATFSRLVTSRSKDVLAGTDDAVIATNGEDMTVKTSSAKDDEPRKSGLWDWSGRGDKGSRRDSVIEKTDKENGGAVQGHHHLHMHGSPHHHKKGKGKEVPDRECLLM